MTSRLSRHALSCALAWLLCSALYLWTAEGVSSKYADRNNAWHHYEYLVDGFLAGHTYLSRAPAPELLALPDPYDPKINGKYRLWDASLYQGKFYLYFGPTPALLSMLPYKLLAGRHLPQWAASALFACAGLGAIALLLAGIRRRSFSSATPHHLFWAIVLVGHLSWLLVILRRSALWELPTIAAAALLWWSLFFLWRFRQRDHVTIWAVATGVTLSFVLGARPTYLFSAGFIALLFTLPWERPRSLVRHALRLLPVLGPLIAGGAGLLLYNYLRFGQFSEFGQHLMLWGRDVRGLEFFSLGNIPLNTWLYFFSVPDFGSYFPFLHPISINDVPPDYYIAEDIHGIVFTLPAFVLGFVALTWSRAHRLLPVHRSTRVIILAATATSLLAAAVFFTHPGSSSRYLCELLAGWSLVSGIGFLALFNAPPGKWLIRIRQPLAVLLLTWTFANVWLASFESHRLARGTQPKFYSRVAEFLNYPSHWVAEHQGRKFGPVALDIRLSDTFAPGATTVLATGNPGLLNRLVVDRLAPRRIRLRVVIGDQTFMATPVMETTGTLIHVELHTPWLFPPAAHPYWQRFSDPEQRRQLQIATVLATPAISLIADSTAYFDPIRFEPYVLTAAMGQSGGAWVEKWSRLDPMRSIAGTKLTAPAAVPATSSPAAVH
jgi:hypothetical protein